MAEQLPNPSVIIPCERETLRATLDDQRLDWLGALSSQGRGSYDGQRNARQAMANLNALLDHYPHGAPRDFIAQHGDVVRAEPTVPELVELGQE